MKSQNYVVNCINSICRTFHTLYNINWGGCCYIAYIIADYLEKHEIPFSVVILDDRYKFSNFEDINIAVSHVCIKVDLTYINKFDNYKNYYFSEFIEVNSQQLLDYYYKVKWANIYLKAQNTFLKSIFNKMMNHAIH